MYIVHTLKANTSILHTVHCTVCTAHIYGIYILLCISISWHILCTEQCEDTHTSYYTYIFKDTAIILYRYL